MILCLVSQDGHGAAAEILAIRKHAQAGAQADLCVGHLARAAFAAQLAHRFDNVQRAPAVDGWPTLIMPPLVWIGSWPLKVKSVRSK
jgi:hypothetical protein